MYVNQIVKGQTYILAGDIITKQEKRPIISRKSLAEADVILYQLSCAFDMEASYIRWFPTLYCYMQMPQAIWTRLCSKRHCDNLFPYLMLVHSQS